MNLNKNELTRRQFGKKLSGAALLALSKDNIKALSMKKEFATSEIVDLDAKSLSEAIRIKEISCAEVMEAYLARIYQLNPRYNAIVSLRDHDQLIAEAKEADADLTKGNYRGWMHGFPQAPKDLADANGMITTYGSPIFKNNMVTQDSIHIERMRKAGSIFIGKTNVPEWGLGSQSYNPVFGATLNAYDGLSTAGGSSGGAAAALALKLLPVADGSDLMGSLRNPAAFNNVIGFRPTPGRVPQSQSYVEELPCTGPMARNVQDTAMLLSTQAGYDARFPSSYSSDHNEFLNSLKSDFKGSRIGWLGDFNGYLSMQEGVMPLCEKALDGFRKIGCEVEALDLGYSMESLWQTWLTFRHWLVRGRLLPLYNNPATRSLLKPEAVWEIEGGKDQSANDVYNASMKRAEWYKTVNDAFEQYDYLVLPTAQVFPFDATVHWPKSITGKTMDTYHRWMEVVIPGTLSGCPVVNVPAGFGDNGLPQGLQIIGPRHKDFAVLQIAYAYEQTTRWNLDYSPKEG